MARYRRSRVRGRFGRRKYRRGIRLSRGGYRM